MTNAHSRKILVLGAGNFGTCLAQHLALKGHSVTLWARDPEVVRAINAERQNPKYLTRVNLSQRIMASQNLLSLALTEAYAVVLAIPTQSLRGVLSELAMSLRAEQLLISAAKGIENKTLLFPLAIIKSVLGEAFGQSTVVLSGPSFAEEVAEGQPTAVSLGSHSESTLEAAQELFHTPYFRAYTMKDPMGLEVAGALKNVIAIAAGAADGLAFQLNARAALLTRGLAEINRFGQLLGSDPLTFNGLGGVGDLFLTCNSPKSRNFRLGFELGKGKSLAMALKSLGSVAEGVTTAESAYELARQLKADAPIVSQVFQVLYRNKPIHDAVMSLLTREAKPEFT